MEQKISDVIKETSWVIAEERENTVFEISRIQVNSETYIMHNEEIKEDLNTNIPVGFIFASKLRFEPKVNETKLNLIRKIVTAKSKSKFKEILEQNGVTNVRHHDSSRNTVNESEIDTYKYKGCVTIRKDVEIKISSYCMIFKSNNNYFLVGFAEPSTLSESIKSGDYKLDSKYNTKRIINALID